MLADIKFIQALLDKVIEKTEGEVKTDLMAINIMLLGLIVNGQKEIFQKMPDLGEMFAKICKEDAKERLGILI